MNLATQKKGDRVAIYNKDGSISEEGVVTYVERLKGFCKLYPYDLVHVMIGDTERAVLPWQIKELK